MGGLLSGLWGIIAKNFLLLYRSKTSSLIMVLGPLFIILCVGTAFNSSELHSVKVGVYSSTYNGFTDDLIGRLEYNKFIVLKAPRLIDCIEQLQQSKLNLCLYFPKNFDPKIQDSNDTIRVYVDYSRLNLAANIWEVIQSDIANKSIEVGEQLVSKIVKVLNETQKEVEEHQVTVIKLQENARQTKEMVGEINGDLNATEFKFEVNISAIDRLSDEMSKNFDNIQNISRQINELENKLGMDLNSLMANKTYLEGQYNVTCTTPNSSIEVQQQCAELSRQIASLEAQIGKLKVYIAGIEPNKDQLVDIGEGTESVSLNLGALERSINRTREGFANASRAKEGAESEIENLKGSLSDTISILDNLTTAFNQLESNLKNISISNPNSIVTPIKTEIKPITEQRNFIYYLFPSLLLFVIMFMGVLLSSTFIINEKESKAYMRNLIAPIGRFLLFLGCFVTLLIIVIVQALVVMGIGAILYEIPLFENGAVMLLICLVLSAVFVLIGLLIGYMFNSEETATVASISLSCVLFLFSSSVLPLEKMSPYLSQVARFNPFILGEGMLKQAIFFNAAPSSFSAEMWIVLAYFAVLLLAVLYVQRTSILKRIE